MTESLINSLADTLGDRCVATGGFSGYKGGPHRPDATAWAVLVLSAAGKYSDLVEAGRQRLSADQGADGRVTVCPEMPQPFWPTALSVLAWHGDATFRQEQCRAVEFLLSTTGKHWHKRINAQIGHDSSIRGWPWIEDTHSWVEPTSLALLALDLTGLGDHERCHEARHMLLDRQLPQGGWNYGNTTVFGQMLRPMPESTGMALNALASRGERSQVGKSIAYLLKRVDALSTPLSLGWVLLGLRAWGEQPSQTPSLLQHCYDKQDIVGHYETTQLALLLAALLGAQGLLSCITPAEVVR